MRVFVATLSLPRPDRHAGHSRFCAILQILAQRHRVDFWMPEGPPEEAVEARAVFAGLGVNVLPFGNRGLQVALTFSRYHLGVFEFFSAAEAILSYFRLRQPSAVAVIDSVDVHYVRQQSATTLGLTDQEVTDQLRIRELNAYRSADAVIAASDPDATILRTDGIANVFTVPTIYLRRERRLIERESEILFVGGFKHPPNLDGILWFMREIWPIVKREAPEAHLTIVGSDPTPKVAALASEPGVTVTGYVPDVNPYLDRAAVSIAPLRYGGGMKGKVVEAALAGVPIVATSFGVQGIPITSAVDGYVADDPAEFAEAVVTLLKNPERARQLGLSGQSSVSSLCTPEAAAGQVNAMVARLVPRPRAVAPMLRWVRGVAQYSMSVMGRRMAALLGRSG